MKKLCIVLLALSLCLGGCAVRTDAPPASPPSTTSTPENTGETEPPEDTEEREDGAEKEEEKEESVHTHQYLEVSSTPATCTEDGAVVSRCECGKQKTSSLPLLGHEYAETSASPSRLLPCVREGCDGGILPATSLSKERPCTYTQAMRAEMEEQYAVMTDFLAELSVYEEGSHDYVAGSSLDRKNTEFKGLFDEYDDALVELGAQYQYGQLAYHLDMQNAEKANTYNEVQQYYAVCVSRYYGVYETVHRSALRNYFYQGWSQASIERVLSRASGAEAEEILTLKNANVELEMQFYSLENPSVGNGVLSLYGQFVENNKQIATLSGYTNYMEYAYKEAYSRDYAYTFFDEFYAYVKEYITPLYAQYEQAYRGINLSALPSEALAQYKAVKNGSFFESVYANTTLNDFLDTVVLDGVSYGQKMGEMFTNGDFYLGEYRGAYAWRLEKEGVPFLYFGEGYREAFTVAHEFGHYMNYICNGSGGSFDLMETHSQGMEMLYLYALKEKIHPAAYEALKTATLYDGLRTVLLATSVNKFEQTVYTENISPQEYDLLYAQIQADLGLGATTYWRHVTIPSPAYYISYAVSMIGSMQLYIESESAGAESGIAAYLKIVKPATGGLTYAQILTGAGLRSYDEEALYEALYEALNRA